MKLFRIKQFDSYNNEFVLDYRFSLNSGTKLDHEIKPEYIFVSPVLFDKSNVISGFLMPKDEIFGLLTAMTEPMWEERWTQEEAHLLFLDKVLKRENISEKSKQVILNLKQIFFDCSKNGN